MSLEQAARTWKQRLDQGQSLNRIRVRRLLELAGAERRGWAVVRRISETLESNGLRTEPDFRSAWIDGAVSIRSSGDLSQRNEELAPASTTASAESFEGDEFSDPVAAFSGNWEYPNGRMVSGAESLNVDIEDAGVIQAPSSAPERKSGASLPTDPVRRISSIKAANLPVVSVNINDALCTATTRMMIEGYSQLAIMQGERHVRGMISWDSIAKRYTTGPTPTSVADCRVDAQVIEADGSIFDALPIIEKHGSVLVSSKGKITGILTASDLAIELGTLSHAFVSIGVIEGLIRNMLHFEVTGGDLETLEEHSKARKDADVSALTFGENIRLLEREDIWGRLQTNLDKRQFLERLRAIREIRNEVMHFNPDAPDAGQRKALEQMEQFLRQISSYSGSPKSSARNSAGTSR